MLSFFPRGVLDEILNLIESVSEGFPSYFSVILVMLRKQHSESFVKTRYETNGQTEGRNMCPVCLDRSDKMNGVRPLFLVLIELIAYSSIQVFFLWYLWKCSPHLRLIICLIRDLFVSDDFAPSCLTYRNA